MSRVNVSSVQQYTLDRLRVSLSSSYATSRLKSLRFAFLKDGVEDVTDRLKSIAESNEFQWEYLEEATYFDLYLKENTQIEEGKYKFILYGINTLDSEETGEWSFQIGHMEDVRVEIDRIEFVNIRTIHVVLKPITQYYQSLEAMRVLQFSIMDENSNKFSDLFQPLHEAIDAELAKGATEIREFTLRLRDGKTLPMDYYDVRLTSLYKSRTFSIIEKMQVRFPFMTTTPPQITSVNVIKRMVNNEEQTCLKVTFNPFLMYGLMLPDGADNRPVRHDHREIIRHSGNGNVNITEFFGELEESDLNITNMFDSSRGSTKDVANTNIPYITSFELRLVTENYSLEKGKYTIRWWWDDDWYDGIYKPIEFDFTVGWVVPELEGLEIFEGRFIDFDLPKAEYTDKFLDNYHLLVELNGQEIDTSDIFGSLQEVGYLKTGVPVDRSDHFGVRILDMDKIEPGMYTFILWKVRDYDLNGYQGDIYYQYIGYINIVEALTPKLKEVYQSNVDTLTVILSEPIAIEALRYCTINIFDSYGNMDFSNRLMTIEQSNIWAIGQTMTDRFDLIIKNDQTLASGQYQLTALFKDNASNTIHCRINHVESRRGLIERVEQIALNKIRIDFTEFQSRQFLLTTEFRVLNKNTDTNMNAYFEDRFELLENVLKADQPSFKSLEIMMDKFDSLPAGRYEIQFVYVYTNENGTKMEQMIYSFTVELGYMTNNIPVIKYVNMDHDEETGDLVLEFQFDIYSALEQHLCETATLFCIRQTDGVDIEHNFEEKDKWAFSTIISTQGTTTFANIRIPALPVEYAHIERGIYDVGFTWEGVIPYMEDISKQVVFPWNLPKIVKVEMVAMNMEKDTARMYFEFSETMQYSYLENLKVEVIDPQGRNANDYFSTIAASNKLDPTLQDKDKLSTNSINLDITDIRKLVSGVYQFVFYTEVGGVRISDWLATYNVKTGILPRFANVYQSSMTTITMELKEPISRMLLEELQVSVRHYDKTDVSDQFKTITQSNSDQWDEGLRELTTFQIELISGGYVEKGPYEIYLYNYLTVCDYWFLNLEAMAAGFGALSWFKPVALHILEARFKQLEKAALFYGLDLIIESMPPSTKDYSDHIAIRFSSEPDRSYTVIEYDENGNEVKNNVVVGMQHWKDDDGNFTPDFFDELHALVKKPIPDSMYSVRWEQSLGLRDPDWLDGFPDKMYIRIPFVSNTYPYLSNVTLTLLNYVDDVVHSFENGGNGDIHFTEEGEILVNDNTAMIIYFNPGLELTLYEDSNFNILKNNNRDLDFTDRFEDIKSGDISTYEDQYGNTYVQTVTIPFKKMETLNRDQYLFRFWWDHKGIHNYMRPLEQTELIDHILFPLLKVEQISMDTVRLWFKSARTTKEMRRCEVEIDTTKTVYTADGPERVIVDFTYNFLSMQITNDFSDDNRLVPYIDVKLGARNPNEQDPARQARDFLPPDLYRFMITQKYEGSYYDKDKNEWVYPEEPDYSLLYKYVGSGYIDFMMNLENLYSKFSLYQTSYDTLHIRWEKLQYTELLDVMKFHIESTFGEKEEIIKDFSDRFQSIHDSNYFHRLKNNDEWETGYYEDAEDYAITYDEVSYLLHLTSGANLKIKNGCAIPGWTYQTAFEYNGNMYFNTDSGIIRPPYFMTANPPKIYAATIVRDYEVMDVPYLAVKFSPYADVYSAGASEFQIMTYRGEYADGTIKGEDKTHYFVDLAYSRHNELDANNPDREIRYVNEVLIPINEGAILPSGYYRITWTWPSSSFFPQCIWIGGIGMLGIGLDYARVVAPDTIEVVLLQEVIAKDFKDMILSVRGYNDGDITYRFMTLRNSNTDIPDETKTKTYYLKLMDGETIGGDTYHFVCSQEITDTDESDEGNVIKEQIETLVWEMTIVYMTTDFPNMDALDNLSLQKFEIITLDNYGVYSYLGRDVLPLTSKNANEIEPLTELNKAQYMDKMIRVYGNAAIDKLTAVVDEEITVALIQALEMQVFDAEGQEISECFKLPRDSNHISGRQVLRGILITLNNYDTVKNIYSYRLYIEIASGLDITGFFKEIEDSNNFTSEESRVNSFYIELESEYVVEDYETKGMLVKIANASGKILKTFTWIPQMKTIYTVFKFDIALAPQTTVCPGEYTFKFKYTNDPDLDVVEPVYLEPFAYTGNMPFLSNNLGEILDVTVVDMEKLNLKFSELSFPVKAFYTIEFRLIDSEGNAMPEDTFEPIYHTNDFTSAEFLEDLVEPGIIQLQLNEGKRVPAGQYRLQFWVQVMANEFGGTSDSEEEDLEEDIGLVERHIIRKGEYCLWDKYAQLPLMFREMYNSIKSVEIMDIHRLKVTLEKPTDVDFLRSFTADLYSELKNTTMTGKFEDIEKTNFFGMYVMTTDKSDMLYSADGNYWDTYSTGKDYTYTKCFFHEPTMNYFLLTANGKIMKVSHNVMTGLESGDPEEIEYMDEPVKESLNDFVFVDEKTFVIVGNTGTILRGTIDNKTGEIKLTNINPKKTITKKTLTAVAFGTLNGKDILIAVGYTGTVLKSVNKGVSWEVIPSGLSDSLPHLYDVCFHETTINIEGELEDIELDEDNEDVDPAVDGFPKDAPIEESYVSSGFFICGGKGKILFCSDFEEGSFKELEDVKTTKALFSIYSQENKIIAVGDVGEVVMITDSEDGFDVDASTIYGCNFALRDIEYCNGKFYACGSTGKWVTSSNGDNWVINSSFGSTGIKSIIYIPSQYGEEDPKWFYLRVKNGQEITPVNFYTGWDPPTSDEKFLEEEFDTWETDAQKDAHLGDIYTQFEFADHRAKPSKYYHFKKTATIQPFDDLGIEDEVEANARYELEDVNYSWEQCSGTDYPHHAKYFLRLREKSQDVKKWIYGTKNTIDLPYMTGADLKIKNVELHSPDDEPGVEYFKPYLLVETENASQNCFHYIRYEFKRGSTDCTNWFQSVRVGELQFLGSTDVSGIVIFGNKSMNISSVVKGEYTLRWDWMAPGKAPENEKYMVVDEIEVKNFLPFVSSIYRDDDSADRFYIEFTKKIDSRFFMASNGLDVGIRKVPKSREELESDRLTYNYYQAFQPIESVEDFAQDREISLDPNTGETIYLIDKITMVLKSNFDLGPGNYLIKINTNKEEFKYVKEDENNIWVTCTDDKGLELKDEMTGDIPKIIGVSLERYTPIPTRLDGQSPKVQSLNSLEEANTLLDLWVQADVVADHLADQFTLADGTTYYLKKAQPGSSLTSPSGYEWWKPSDNPYLCVSFNPMPRYSTFVEFYQKFTLNEMVDNRVDEEDDTKPTEIIEMLAQYFRQEIGYFQFDTQAKTDGLGDLQTYVSRCYIPFKPDVDMFPGCDNGTLMMFFPNCIYKLLRYDHIKLPRCYKRYGTIESITPKNPSIAKDDPTAGFIIKLENILSKKFLQTLDFTVTWILNDTQKERLKTDATEIDVSSRFETIQVSNEDDFEDDTIDEMQKLNLWLKDSNGQYIDHGKYRVTLSGEIEEDTIFEIEDATPVIMKKKVKCPWLSTDIPKDITAKLTIEGFKNPVLTVTFIDTEPPRSSFIKSKTDNSVNGKVLVFKHKNRTAFHSSFRALAHTSVKFNFDQDLIDARTGESAERWVKSIDIPMKNNSALPKGTYDVQMRYHKEALLEDVPYEDKYGYTQFKATQLIITRCGAIDEVKCMNAREARVKIKKNDAISTNGKLAKSRVGTVLGISTWKVLLGKFKMKMINGNGKEINKRFYGSAKTTITNNYTQHMIRTNFLINPFVYRFYYAKGECCTIAPRYREFEGLIWNKIGKAANDPRMWIIREVEPDGKENDRAYQKYKKFLTRKKKIKALNTMRKFQYKLCKKCRKVKLLTTNKVSGCINTYDFPYEHKQGIAKFFAQLTKKWYKMRSNNVKIKLAKGKKLNKKGLLVKDKKNPNTRHVYTCNTAPFEGFKFVKTTEGQGAERQVSYSCDHYVSNKRLWKAKYWIATLNPNQIPNDRSKIYIAMLAYKPPKADKIFHLRRGYKSTSKGKKSDAFKKYRKTLKEMVEEKKKNAKRCKKCKKRMIAEKKGVVIGWGSARFPVKVMTKANMKNLPSLLNVAEKKGGFKCKKKKKNGCKNPSFIWTKISVTTTKNKKEVTKAYAKLKCENMKTFPEVLEVQNGYQAIFYK